MLCSIETLSSCIVGTWWLMSTGVANVLVSLSSVGVVVELLPLSVRLEGLLPVTSPTPGKQVPE